MKHELLNALYHSTHSSRNKLEGAWKQLIVTPQATSALLYMARLSGCDFWEAERREVRLLRVP
jgi:hypothetical protein